MMPASEPTTRADSSACANCEAPLRGPFCSSCGQKDRPLDPSIRELLVDLWESMTELDGPILGTIRRLLLSPGLLTQEYFQGRRIRWVSPVRLYLLASLIYFAIGTVTNAPVFDIDFPDPGESSEQVDAWLEVRGLASLPEIQAAVDDAEARWWPRAMILMMPFFAGLVFLVRPRGAGRFPHDLVFALHVHAAWFGLFTLVALGGAAVSGGPIEAALRWIAFLYPAWYVAIALGKAYGGSVPANVARAVLVCGVYWFVALVTSVAIMAPAIFRA